MPHPSLPEGIEETALEGKGGVAVDDQGNHIVFEATADGLNAAMASASDIYFAPNAVIPYKSHAAKIPASGINIHGNGATLDGGECDFALQYTQFAEGSEVNINIYNLNNARIWGDPGVACTYNVTMTNCAFIMRRLWHQPLFSWPYYDARQWQCHSQHHPRQLLR